jgi:hypothetical protein
VQVADAGGTATALPGAIPVAAAPSASLIPACARYCSVEVGCVDVCGNFGTLTGGTAPFTYTVQPGGFVPVGTHLNALSLAGTFTQRAQFWQFTVVVTDALGQTTSITPTFYVFPHISLASGNCFGNYPIGCSAQLAISGGSGSPSVTLVSAAQNPNANPAPYQGTCWSLAATSPPPGYGLTVSGSNVVVSIPKGIIGGYGAVWTVVVTDKSLCGANTYCASPAATIRIGVQCG